MKSKISIVIPAYNEQEVIELFLDKLHEVLNNIKSYVFEVILVNDGSKDSTLEIITQLQESKYKDLVIVNLSRNFGHESAVSAGLNVATGDAVIPMDADMQDPPTVIPLLIEKYEEGFEVVNAKRVDRQKDSFMKRTTASIFYKIIANWSGKVKVPENVGHFRLISRRVLDQVNSLEEVSRVFRVQVPYIGFKTTEVPFIREERAKGVSHYNYKSMTKLALDSIITTTTEPLKYITSVAVMLSIVTFLSITGEIAVLISDICVRSFELSQLYYVGWSIVNVLLIIGACIMISLGIISQYNARAFAEAQRRPMFIIDYVKRNENK